MAMPPQLLKAMAQKKMGTELRPPEKAKKKRPDIASQMKGKNNFFPPKKNNQPAAQMKGHAVSNLKGKELDNALALAAQRKLGK